MVQFVGLLDAANGEFIRWDTPIYASADGSITIVIDASLMPVVDDDGKVVFICAEGRDITQKKGRSRDRLWRANPSGSRSRHDSADVLRREELSWRDRTSVHLHEAVHG